MCQVEPSHELVPWSNLATVPLPWAKLHMVHVPCASYSCQDMVPKALCQVNVHMPSAKTWCMCLVPSRAKSWYLCLVLVPRHRVMMPYAMCLVPRHHACDAGCQVMELVPCASYLCQQDMVSSGPVPSHGAYDLCHDALCLDAICALCQVEPRHGACPLCQVEPSHGTCALPGLVLGHAKASHVLGQAVPGHGAWSCQGQLCLVLGHAKAAMVPIHVLGRAVPWCRCLVPCRAQATHGASLVLGQVVSSHRAQASCRA